MAEVLSLGEPRRFTLDAVAGNLTEVTLPIGTRTVLVSTDEAIFRQISGTDGGAGTVADQQRYTAGTFFFRAPQSNRGATDLDRTVNMYIAGTSGLQVVWMTAQDEA